VTTNRAPATGAPAADVRTTDVLVRLGAGLFALGLLATFGVMVSHDLDVLDWLLPAALTLVPIGFGVAFAGLVLLVKARASSHRQDAD
jgi:hypothetical protein